MADPLAIRIRPATRDDLAACAECWGNRRDTYPSIYPLRLVNPSITREERLQRNVKDLIKMLEDSYNVIHVAFTNNTGNRSEIVGYSIWAKPEALERDLRQWQTSKDQPSSGSTSSDDTLDPECNHDLAAALKEESLQIKHKLSQGKRMWFLQQLFVSDRYQRRGVGTRLLENGLELIKQVDLEKRSEDTSDTLDYDIALTSSPQGKLLYERHGFKDVYWFNPHFGDIDEKGNEIKKDVRWPLMIQQ